MSLCHLMEDLVGQIWGCMSAYRVTLGLSIAVYVLLGCVTLPCTVLPFTVSNACQQTVQLQHWDLYCSPSGLCCMQSLLPADACWLCVAPCAVPPGMHAALLCKAYCGFNVVPMIMCCPILGASQPLCYAGLCLEVRSGVRMVVIVSPIASQGLLKFCLWPLPSSTGGTAPACTWVHPPKKQRKAIFYAALLVCT